MTANLVLALSGLTTIFAAMVTSFAFDIKSKYAILLRFPTLFLFAITCLLGAILGLK